MYRIRYKNSRGTLCVTWNDNLIKGIRAIKRAGGTVVSVSLVED